MKCPTCGYDDKRPCPVCTEAAHQRQIQQARTEWRVGETIQFVTIAAAVVVVIILIAVFVR